MTKETVFALDDAVIRLQAAQEKAALIASDLDDNYFCWNIDGDKKYYVLAYHDDAATRNRIVLDYLSKIKHEANKLQSLVNQILVKTTKSNEEVENHE